MKNYAADMEKNEETENTKRTQWNKRRDKKNKEERERWLVVQQGEVSQKKLALEGKFKGYQHNIQ